MAEKKCGRAMGSTKASEGRKTEPASGRNSLEPGPPPTSFWLLPT